MDERDRQVAPLLLFSWRVEFYVDFVRGIITPQRLKVPQKISVPVTRWLRTYKKSRGPTLAPLGPDNDTLEGVTLKHITMQNPKRTLFTTLNHFCPTILSILLYIK
jgi:hypothetical protein